MRRTSKAAGRTTSDPKTSKTIPKDSKLDLSRTVEKLKAENARKDLKIAELQKQVASPSTTKNRTATSFLSSNTAVIEKLQTEVKQLEDALKEKNETIILLRQQLNQTRSDKESQVSVLKESIEKVIQEKDFEIRRLKAIWSPGGNSNLDESVDEISRATKLLNAPELSKGKQQARFGISAEIRSSLSRSVIKTNQSKPKTLAQTDFIRRALNRNVFLKGLDSHQVEQLIEYMSPMTFSYGSNLISEGEFGTHMYVLEKGRVEVFHSKGGEHTHVIDLKGGEVFGELAILYNCKRTASIRAKTEVSVWCLERRHFQAAVKKTGQKKRQEYIRLLNTVEKLESLSENKLMRIADCLEEASFSKGDYIIRQGDTGDIFYIIQNGKVKVTHTQNQNQNSKEYDEKFIAYLENGQYFGEGALLTEEKRSANIIAESDSVTVLMLDRQAFNSFVGSIADIVRTPTSGNNNQTNKKTQNNFTFDGDRDAAITSAVNQTKTATDPKVLKTALNQLKTISILGQGGFGCVKLVQVPGLPDFPFALKAIRKAKIVENKQEQHILAERNIMMAMNSPFIGKLHRTYKDELYVYLLMDAYLGGELYGVLKRGGPLKEATARFTAACVLEALDYLHTSEVIYRDMKPENLMIDHRGYVKLVDFGFAKHIRPGFKTWTFCGTPEYFPPEILSNLGHDFAADIWSYGILVYELLTKTTPFIAADDMSVYENILNGIEGVKFSKRISKPAEVMIRGLCKFEPRDRLGYQKGGFADVRKQRWFQGFDWQGLRSVRLISPFEIEVESATDTTNFEYFEEEKFDVEEDRQIIEDSFMDWEKVF